MTFSEKVYKVVSKIPCHRVIKSDGGLGHYNKGNKQKEKILKEEAI